MGERPYVCSNGHALANRVTTCPMCGSPGKPVRPSIWSLFAVGLLVLAVAGIGITIVGRGGSSAAEEAAATTSTPSDTVVLDASTTTEATTSTTEATPTSTSTSTTMTTTTTAPPTTTTAPPVTTPPTTIAPVVPVVPPPVTTPPTVPRPTTPAVDARAQQAIARDAAVVAYTTGHRPAGYQSVQTLIAPDLRRRLDALTVADGYRQAGCRQRVSEIRPGPVFGSSYGFSLTIDRTCDRVPRANGYILPLESGAYATIVLGPTGGGSYWATVLQPG